MTANSRYLILSRLRKSQANTALNPPAVLGDRINYNGVESDKKNILKRFRVTLEQLHGEFYHAKTTSKARKILIELLSGFPDKACIAGQFRLLDEILAKDKKLAEKIDLAANLSMSSSEFAAYPAAITYADYLVARTGSVVITSLSGGGRRLSILPPLHIVLAYSRQLVSSIDEVWQNFSRRPLACSSLSIISGPSRTSDIEKELVLGAHGPERLVVIVVDDTAG